MSRAAVVRWGNSSAIRIPKNVLKQANLQQGDEVAFDVEQPGVIRLRAAQKVRTLEELIRAITRENRHEELEWGAPTGNEIW